MEPVNAYTRRRTRQLRIFGTDDAGAITAVLRDRRAALLAGLLRRAAAVLLSGWRVKTVDGQRRWHGKRPA
ncbi:MAG: hypothetical protein M9951_16990 [Burkholderiaceae bacterium]|jgi:hypothetical protein|nr:hypothetical protein [Burkholderiaceae bacterium]MEB2319024.1 hypothetical protein [Pseudomonadota bacterium]